MRNPVKFDPIILSILKSLPPPVKGSEITYSISGDGNYHQFVDNNKFHINVMSIDWKKAVQQGDEYAESVLNAVIGAGYHEWGHFFTEMKEFRKLQVYPRRSNA